MVVNDFDLTEAAAALSGKEPVHGIGSPVDTIGEAIPGGLQLLQMISDQRRREKE